MKILIYILFWGTYFLPIYSFHKAFRHQITDVTGIYNNASFIYLLGSVLITLGSIFLRSHFTKSKLQPYISTCIYLAFYTFCCWSIAWDHRIAFGITWQNHEVLSGLVLPHWYFYVFGLLGLYFNLKYQKLNILNRNFCVAIVLLFLGINLQSCCHWTMRTHYYTNNDSVYYFDYSIQELGKRLNYASAQYYLKTYGLDNPLDTCQSPESYSDWTFCFNKKENAYQRCGYQLQTVYNEEVKGQVDANYHTCWTELQLLKLEDIKPKDSLHIMNNFGWVEIVGNQHQSRLYTPLYIRVQKHKCLPKRKRKTHIINQFEQHIIEPIKNYKGNEAKSILNIPENNIDSVMIYRLYRLGMETYERNENGKKLTTSEWQSVLGKLKDSTRFSGGTPMSFGYTSELVFYFNNQSNSLYLSPSSWKVYQQDFDIPYNRTQTIEELGGAVYFPFIDDEFAKELEELEQKYLKK